MVDTAVATERSKRAIEIIKQIKTCQNVIWHLEKGALMDENEDNYLESIAIEKQEIKDLRAELEGLYALSF